MVKFYSSYSNAAHLISCKAAGSVVPSFSSTLLDGVLTPEEEDIIMWASSQVYLGMFGFRSYTSRFNGVSQVHQTQYSLIP